MHRDPCRGVSSRESQRGFRAQDDKVVRLRGIAPFSVRAFDSKVFFASCMAEYTKQGDRYNSMVN